MKMPRLGIVSLIAAAAFGISAMHGSTPTRRGTTITRLFRKDGEQAKISAAAAKRTSKAAKRAARLKGK